MSAIVNLANYRAGGVEGRPRGKDGWRTPLGLYARLDAEFRFVLDAACESSNQLCRLGHAADRGDDSLLLPWAGNGGPVFCNPPFSNIRPWVAKAAVEGRAETVVMVLPADPGVRWWFDYVAPFAAEIRFLTGRPKFRRPDGSPNVTKRGGGGATTPCAVVVFRPHEGPPAYSYIPAGTA